MLYPSYLQKKEKGDFCLFPFAADNNKPSCFHCCSYCCDWIYPLAKSGLFPVYVEDGSELSMFYRFATTMLAHGMHALTAAGYVVVFSAFLSCTARELVASTLTLMQMSTMKLCRCTT